jgi:hypothetical protein
MKTKVYSLDYLKRRAGRLARQQGHRLRWEHPSGHPAIPHLDAPESWSCIGFCKCGAEVTVRTTSDHFAPVTGTALALKCDHFPATA